jgi:hypothetical protein
VQTMEVTKDIYFSCDKGDSVQMHRFWSGDYEITGVVKSK